MPMGAKGSTLYKICPNSHHSNKAEPFLAIVKDMKKTQPG